MPRVTDRIASRLAVPGRLKPILLLISAILVGFAAWVAYGLAVLPR